MSLAITVKTDPEVSEWGGMVGQFLEDFEAKLNDAHLKWVFMVLEYTQKYSRVDTGRSRAAWTPIMDKYGYDYQRSMPVGDRQNEDDILQGKNEGQFYEDPLHTTIVNNVEYVDPMNRRYGIFGFAPSRAAKGGRGIVPRKLSQGIRFEDRVPLFEEFGQVVMQKLADNSKAAMEAHKTFKPKEIEPVENDPPLSM